MAPVRRHPQKITSEDVLFLMHVAGVDDPIELINPICFKAPVAPMVAAKMEKGRVGVEKIMAAYEELRRRHEFLVVEGIGGALVPFKENYFVADLARDMGLAAVVVARPGLGTINHTALTVEALRSRGVEIAGIIINNAAKDVKDSSVKSNSEIIENITKLPVLGVVPHYVGAGFKPAPTFNLNKIIYKSAPNRNSQQLKTWDKQFVWHPFTQMKDYIKEDNLVIEEARGIYIKDTDGNWYLDGVSSLWVNVHGHRNKTLDDAVRSQLDKVAHSTLLGLGNKPSVELAKEMINIAPKGLAKVFYSDSGSTAVEIALKMAFQYWQQQPGRAAKSKTKFISFMNAYHGDTIGSVSVGGMDLFHQIYKPLLFKTIKANYPYCYRCHLGRSYPKCNLACLKKLEGLIRENHNVVAGLIIEPLVQAAAGMLVSPPKFLTKVRQLCTKYDILLIADEVAVGFGRTGRMFACEHEKVTPDLMTLAKGITGGYLPLAATLASGEVFDGFLADYKDQKTFFHGHTYTGNPLACQAALANLGLFRKKGFFKALDEKVRFLTSGLEKFKGLEHVGDIRQKGMMVGIELVKDKSKKISYKWEDKMGVEVVKHVRRAGIILRPLGNVIVLMPPLSINREELGFLLKETRRSIEVVTIS